MRNPLLDHSAREGVDLLRFSDKLWVRIIHSFNLKFYMAMRHRCDEVVTKSEKTGKLPCYIANFEATDMNGVQEAAGSNPVTRTKNG